MTGDIQPLKHGMTTDELLAAWKRRLPNTEPTDNQLSCFAIGIEVGRATDAQDTHLIAAAVRAGERARLRSIIMAKHEAAKGQHNLYHCLAVELMEQGADVITFLAAPPAPAAVPLTDEQVAAALAAWFGVESGFDDRMRAAFAAAHGIAAGERHE